jgi:hypothetical protein
LLREACAHAQKGVLVSTPKYETAQEELCGNALEKHRSVWAAKDFRRIGPVQVKTLGGDTLLAIFPRSTLPKLKFQRPRKREAGDLRLQLARKELLKLVQPDTQFILVDEEQMRGTLSYKGALPFLERDGQYWGAPEDDKTAIDELERLHESGAQLIVFIPSTFWWLQHYGQFAEYLRATYKCLRDDAQLIAFDLGGGDQAGQ